jgi:hypothetical protein
MDPVSGNAPATGAGRDCTIKKSHYCYHNVVDRFRHRAAAAELSPENVENQGLVPGVIDDLIG